MHMYITCLSLKDIYIISYTLYIKNQPSMLVVISLSLTLSAQVRARLQFFDRTFPATMEDNVKTICNQWTFNGGLMQSKPIKMGICTDCRDFIWIY